MTEPVNPIPALTRRRLLGGVLGVTATAFGAGTLTSCSTNKDSRPEGGGVNTVALPEYVPFEGSDPQLPRQQPGAPAGYTEFPADLVTTVRESPLKGGQISAMTNIFQPLPTPRPDNAAWQQVEKQLGGKLDLTIVPASDYAAKFQTMLASGDFPDVSLLVTSVIDDLPAFMDSVCADLTPFLSGESVKEYPNLAAIPPIIWETCVVANKIYTLPIPGGLVGGAGFYNHTLLDKAGVSAPESAEDFAAAMQELTRPQDGQWGIVNQKGNTFFVLIRQMFGVPNRWREEAGGLENAFETDEYKAALEYAVQIHKSGVIVPGSDGIDGQARKNAFSSRKGAYVYDGLPAYPEYRASMSDQDPRPAIPAGPEGKPPVTWFDNIVYSNVILKKGDDARIREVLSTLNFLAAPFGSTEHLLLNYGVEGSDFAFDGAGRPVLTDQGTRDLTVPWDLLIGPQQAIFDADTEYVENYHSAASQLISTAVKDPTANLTSTTADRKDGEISQAISDVRNDIIAGRKDLSAWDPAVAEWRKNGGDQIRGEYEDALAAGSAPR